MKLKLVKATREYERQITEMLDEWYASGEKIIPYAIRRLDYHNFEFYCNNLEIKDTNSDLVPDSTFFCLDEERNIMVGAINIRKVEFSEYLKGLRDEIRKDTFEKVEKA